MLYHIIGFWEIEIGHNHYFSFIHPFATSELTRSNSFSISLPRRNSNCLSNNIVVNLAEVTLKIKHSQLSNENSLFQNNIQTMIWVAKEKIRTQKLVLTLRGGAADDVFKEGVLRGHKTSSPSWHLEEPGAFCSRPHAGCLFYLNWRPFAGCLFHLEAHPHAGFLLPLYSRPHIEGPVSLRPRSQAGRLLPIVRRSHAALALPAQAYRVPKMAGFFLSSESAKVIHGTRNWTFSLLGLLKWKGWICDVLQTLESRTHILHFISLINLFWDPFRIERF